MARHRAVVISILSLHFVRKGLTGARIAAMIQLPDTGCDITQIDAMRTGQERFQGVDMRGLCHEERTQGDKSGSCVGVVRYAPDERRHSLILSPRLRKADRPRSNDALETFHCH